MNHKVAVQNTMKEILVIEDDDVTRENIAEGLMYSGYVSFQAPDGVIGVQMAQEHLPDLILCDINMPGMNGYEVLATLRGIDETANIPFIFLTAQADRQSYRDGMALGADDYISKPFDHEELLRAIETRLEKQTKLTQTYELQIQTLRHTIVQTIPHELRTPLMSILGYAELMMMDGEYLPPKDVQSMAEQISKAGWRLHHVIENYLVYAQIELIFQDPLRHNAMLHDRLEQPLDVIQQIVKHSATQHQREITYICQDTIPSLVISNENLSKIMMELTDNACKFSQPNTPIQVEIVRTDEYARISVHDCGRGMTEEQIKAVGAYMQFERAMYEQQGLGLGLAISKRLAELYGGGLKIESTVNEYTRVTVSLVIA